MKIIYSFQQNFGNINSREMYAYSLLVDNILQNMNSS